MIIMGYMEPQNFLPLTKKDKKERRKKKREKRRRKKRKTFALNNPTKVHMIPNPQNRWLFS